VCCIFFGISISGIIILREKNFGVAECTRLGIAALGESRGIWLVKALPKGAWIMKAKPEEERLYGLRFLGEEKENSR